MTTKHSEHSRDTVNRSISGISSSPPEHVLDWRLPLPRTLVTAYKLGCFI